MNAGVHGREGERRGVAPTRWDNRTRLSLVSLTLGVFALVFSEFLPAGILTDMAADLRISEGMAGQTVSAIAVVDRHLFRLISGTALIMGVSALGIVWLGQAPWTVVALVYLWGFGFGAVPIALLT